MRIPRPMGTTLLAKNYREESTKSNLSKLRNHIIKAFISRSLIVKSTIETKVRVKDKDYKKALKAYNLLSAKQKNKTTKPTKYKELHDETMYNATYKELSLILGIGSLIKLEARVSKVLLKETSTMASEQGIRELQAHARANSAGLFFGILGKVPEMNDWARELQGVTRIKGYMPAMVMATNTAMGQASQQTEKALNLAIKLAGMEPSSRVPNNAFIQNNFGTQHPEKGLPGPDGQTQYLTPTMALRMLEEKGLTRVELDTDLLAAKYGIMGPDIPDVKAMASDAQGAKNFRIEDLIQVPNSADRHDTHREREEDIEEVIIAPAD